MKTVREEVLLRAMGLKREDLLAFIVSACEGSPEILAAFQSRFADGILEDAHPAYEKMVAAAICEAEEKGRGGLLEAVFLADILEALHTRIDELLLLNKYQEVFEICHLILQKLPACLDRIPEEAYEVEGRTSLAAEQMCDLFAGETPGAFKNEFVGPLLPLIGQKDIQNWGYDEILWEGLIAADLNQENLELLLQEVDRILGQDQNAEGSWEATSWIDRKMELMTLLGKGEEIEGMLRSYMHLPEIRILLVKRERNAGQLDRAKILIREGMQIEIEKGLQGRPMDWRMQLLEIAELEGDQAEIRSHAQALFDDGLGDFKFYDLLKSTFSPEDWKSEVDKFIQTLSVQQNKVFANRAATILKTEGYEDRLLAFLQADASDYHLIKDHADSLEKNYPDEVLAMFRNTIEVFAKKHTGRSYYHELVQMLRHLEQVGGGSTLQAELLLDFRERYTMKPDMLAILGDAFPEG